ncbi:PREDICTED: chromatin structure-remodeling complex protein SYD isoform X2 [Ipomoea nil]|uniref:chromatin structure-remodeling complex protein SYD isoform X2 n=1 Tax=Ipomoea nil TaxID=35883 RepID=UPI000901D9B0|nr:PREDICTED: chromatin structure-remodeling complex protein SYD isoform X2 [Ipomoea nil]
MANPPNVELEAAKFLHKLIQESTDEPTKLATKLYVILQHMRSSGKENSMPYQVISRAMETVVKQNNLDIEALMSSRLPSNAGMQVGDSSSSQLAGSLQRAGITRDSKAALSGAEIIKPDAFSSSRPPSGHGIYQGSAANINASKIHGVLPSASNSSQPVESGISSPLQFGSPSYDNHGLVAKMHQDRSSESFPASPSADLSAGKCTSGRPLEHEVGTSMLANVNNTNQGGMQSNALETSMLRSATIRDTGKLPVAQPPASGNPFKEHHLKQLRAQCLVFLAFRNGLMPKKVHLEFALGNAIPKEDGTRRDLVDQKGREHSVREQSNASEATRSFLTGREVERLASGPSSLGIPGDANMSKEAENQNVMEDRGCQLSVSSEHGEDRRCLRKMRKIPEGETTVQEGTGSQASASRLLHPESNSLGATDHEDASANSHQLGMPNQASFVLNASKQIKPELNNWSGPGGQTETSRSLASAPTILHESGSLIKDATNQSQNPVDYNQGIRQADNTFPNFPVRQQWKSVSVVDSQFPSTVVRNAVPAQEVDEEEEDISLSTERLPSPRHTTLEKWILDRQKRKLLSERKWALKQQKTEERISASSSKLKESVSSSEDISAKTKSVIELKKLQLLELQRRLRRDILNDFFKPITADMERLKAIKKTRIGRRSKQLERYEQKMKEERQKRIRERQKEFFSEVEVHRERLEDVFKMKRERWKGINRYVKEFHKRKERIHREKIDRIQREKINLLKINDVEGYLRMVQDAKSDRVKQLLKETEKYLQKLGSKLKEAKGNTGVVVEDEIAFDEEDETDQAKHYLESNEKYYMMAHSVKENIAGQPTCLVGGKLREYQMNGLRWLVSLYNNHLNGILADEMGLGKTVQVISLICYLMETKNDRGPFLVVVPSSVLPGWVSEINFWAPSINKIIYSGPPEERRRLFKERIVQQKFNVLLTTYEYLMNKHDRPKLSKIQWHYVIIDEGHRIKNASCKLNADLKHYRSNHRLLLTGTPLQNNLEELWALLNFLLPNIFNSSEDFSQWFNKPFEGNGDNSPDEALLSEEENLLIINRLHQVLRPFVLRRLKHKVENQLPEKIERLVRCEASAYQKLLMKRVEDNLGAIGTSKARSVHNSVMELRNICNHPYLSQLHVEEVHEFIPKHYLPYVVRLCGKLEVLDRLLPKLKATDHRVLLFSTMTRLLDVMEEYLYWKQYKYLRLDGHTSGGERGALIEKFNDPNSPYFIFLLSIRAGGVGVNLQAADTVIIFDTDWNPQVDLQAQARAHRIGQKKDVLVLRLETVQTVEEQVRAAAEHKLGVANQSITAGFFDNNTSAEDRREYLESLLRESKKEEAAPVLNDDALNDLIARSESEIDVFESIDKRRQEEEMVVWKKLCSEKGAENSESVPPLPSRLLTEEDLKPFYEAMKISDDTPTVIPSTGVKRKGQYLGGLDTQHYGRGKRAREVRSYEEQWTEEEFEKMCLAESPESPVAKDEMSEKKLPASSSSTVANAEEQVLPSIQSSEQTPVPIVQHSTEVTPPSKRGRGRPKRTVPVANVSPPPITVPATKESDEVITGSNIQNASSCPVTLAPRPESMPGSSVEGVTGTIQQNTTTCITPTSQSISLPAVPAVPQPNPPGHPTSGRGRGRGQGRGRKSQIGEAPRRRGKKQNTIIQTVPVCQGNPDTVTQTVNASSSSRTNDQDPVPHSTTEMETGKGQSSVSPAPPASVSKEPTIVSGLPVVAPSSTSKELNSVSPVPLALASTGKDENSVSPAPVFASSASKESSSHSAVPVISSSPAASNSRTGSERAPITPSPSVLGSVSSDNSSTMGVVGKQDSGNQLALTSGPAAPMPITNTVLHASAPTPAPKQGRGRGRKPQTGGEAPRRRGKRQDLATNVGSEVSANQILELNEPPHKKSRVSVGRKPTTRSNPETEASLQTNLLNPVTSRITKDLGSKEISNSKHSREVEEQSAVKLDPSQTHDAKVNDDMSTRKELHSESQVLERETDENLRGEENKSESRNDISGNVSKVASESCSNAVQSAEIKHDSVLMKDGVPQQIESQNSLRVELGSSKSGTETDSSKINVGKKAIQTASILESTAVVGKSAKEKCEGHSGNKDDEKEEQRLTSVVGPQASSQSNAEPATIHTHKTEVDTIAVVEKDVSSKPKSRKSQKIKRGSSTSFCVSANPSIEVNKVEITTETLVTASGSESIIPDDLDQKGDSKMPVGKTSATNGALGLKPESIVCSSLQNKSSASKTPGEVDPVLECNLDMLDGDKSDTSKIESDNHLANNSIDSKPEVTEDENNPDKVDRKELDQEDPVLEVAPISKPKGTDNLDGMTSSILPSSEADVLVSVSPQTELVIQSSVQSDVGQGMGSLTNDSLAQVCKVPEPKPIADSSGIEKVQTPTMQTSELQSERQTAVAKSLSDKSDNDHDVQAPEIKNDVSEDGANPETNESQPSPTLHTSESHSEMQVTVAGCPVENSERDHTAQAQEIENNVDMESQPCQNLQTSACQSRPQTTVAESPIDKSDKDHCAQAQETQNDVCEDAMTQERNVSQIGTDDKGNISNADDALLHLPVVCESETKSAVESFEVSLNPCNIEKNTSLAVQGSESLEPARIEPQCESDKDLVAEIEERKISDVANSNQVLKENIERIPNEVATSDDTSQPCVMEDMERVSNEGATSDNVTVEPPVESQNSQGSKMAKHEVISELSETQYNPASATSENEAEVHCSTENQSKINTDVILGDIKFVDPKSSSVDDHAVDEPESKKSDANKENQMEINAEVISGDIQGVEPKFSSVEGLAIDVPQSQISDANEGISKPEVNEGEHATAFEASKNDSEIECISDDLGTVTSKEATSIGIVGAGEKLEVNDDTSYPLPGESKCSAAPRASEEDSEAQLISENLEIVEVRVVTAAEKSENPCGEDSAVQVQENQRSDKTNDISNSEISDPEQYIAAEASQTKQIAENVETGRVRQATSVDSGFVAAAGNSENPCGVNFTNEVQDNQISDGNKNVSKIEISEPSIAAGDSEIVFEMKQISENVATEAVREGTSVEVTAEEKSENSCQEDLVPKVQVEQDIDGNEHISDPEAVESSMYTVAEASEVMTEMEYTSEKLEAETAKETTSVDFAFIAAENSENQIGEDILVEEQVVNNKNKDNLNPTEPEPCSATQASEVESKMKQILETVETETILDDTSVEDVTLAAAENSQMISENMGIETVRQSTSVDYAVVKEAGNFEDPCGEVLRNQVSDENKGTSNTGIAEPEPSTAFGASETHSEMKLIFEIVETETVKEDISVEVGALATEENSEMISHNTEKEIAGEVSSVDGGALAGTEISENPSQKDFMVEVQENKKSDGRGHEPTTVASCNEVEIKQIPQNSEMVTAKAVTLLEAEVVEVPNENLEKIPEDSAVEVQEKFYDAIEDVSNLESNKDQNSPVGTSGTKDDFIQMAVETSETVTYKETVSDISLATDLKGDISFEKPVDGSHGIPCINDDPIVESEVGDCSTAADEGLPSALEGDDKDLSHQ